MATKTTLGPHSLESLIGSETFRLYCKGLVSEEVIKDDDKKIGGIGLAICDSEDNRLLEMKKALGDDESTHQEVAELVALVHGLEWALELNLGKLTFFCDDSNVFQYVIGEAEPKESNVATLVKEVTLLQSRFSFCQALAVSGDITFVYQLAKRAINSQIRWLEGNIYMETCPLCYEDVPSDDKFEVHGCLHRFCVNCIREHVITTLQRWKPATCPASGCNSELEAEDCEGFLGPGHLATMTKRKRESMIKFSDRVYCQEPTCNALMSKQSLLEYTGSFFVGAEQSGTRKCMECGFCFCINCQIGWHCNMTCEEYQKTEAYQTSHKAMFMSQAEREGWQRCRECNDMIHLVDGCKHITCRICKFEFCYTCGAEWRNKKATCNCPLWD